MSNSTEYPAILKALHFASIKHKDQRRKDKEASPYINHPIEVAELLARVGQVTDLVVLQSAILHDTIEDTETTAEEIEELFGADG
jgi:guanosine-3',5'-bis(diphosphate) 3'-pyrophosphohydrolase